ncbi:MAG: anhydro-N-acetylmuramic acid kinase [Bacteroidota bacterium]
MSHSYYSLGTMSGTSMDGLDLAYVKFDISEDSYEWELLQTGHVPFDETWQSRLMHLSEQSAEIFAKTHVYLGHWYGKEIRRFIKEKQIAPDVVAVHGQTIFHQPQKNFTTQIGDGETIVSYLDCPVVCNFRNKDVALGGQGAPLVPLGERFLFPEFNLFLNLGGIANLTYGDQAFDICACNLILNYIFNHAFPDEAENYDDGGAIASSGSVNHELLQQLNGLVFFQKEPPKSLGWEWIEEEILPILQEHKNLPPQDLLRSLVEHMAFQISQSISQVNAKHEKLLVTGGGKHHSFLIERLAEYLKPTGVEISESAPSEWIDYKEAIVFAFLGLRVLEGKSTSMSSVTGTPRDVVGGSIHVPPFHVMSYLPKRIQV